MYITMATLLIEGVAVLLVEGEVVLLVEGEMVLLVEEVPLLVLLLHIQQSQGYKQTRK